MQLLASREDVASRLGRAVDESETTRVDGLLEEASSEVLEFCRRTEFIAPVPDAVRLVVSRMVARSMEAPQGVVGRESTTNEAIGFSQTHRTSADASSGGVWMTKADRRKLRRYSLAYGAFSVDLQP